MATAVTPNVLSAAERRRAANAQAIEAIFDLTPTNATRLLDALTSGEVSLPNWPVALNLSLGRGFVFEGWLAEGSLPQSWKSHLGLHLRANVSYVEWTAKHVLVYGLHADAPIETTS